MPARKTFPRASLEKRPLRVLRELAQLESAEGLPTLLGPRVVARHSFRAWRAAARKLLEEQDAASAEPSPRASLEKRTLRVLRQLVRLDSGSGLAALLGPRVAARHSLAAFRAAAETLIAERERVRAGRLGEPALSDAEQDALRRAGSRLLGLGAGGSPLAGFSDEALESVRRERDPARLAEVLGELDPEGGWAEVPRMGLFAGLVLVSVSSEAARRYRQREAENRSRIREARARKAAGGAS